MVWFTFSVKYELLGFQEISITGKVGGKRVKEKKSPVLRILIRASDIILLLTSGAHLHSRPWEFFLQRTYGILELQLYNIIKVVDESGPFCIIMAYLLYV